MREKIVSKWKNIDNDECLLFFAQTVEELLFYYTIDSYRLPAHNTHSLLDESLSTIQHIKQDILKPGALNSIIEEIEDQFEKDIVMRDFFGTECPELIKHINSSKSIDHKYDTIKYLSQRIENNYLDLLIKRIRSCIEKNERKDIIFLTKSLIIEINKYLQYSKEYIYDQCMHIFFKSKVDGISSYDRFIESFKNDDFEYNILFRIGKGFNQVKKSLNIKYFKIYENLKESDDAYKKWNKHSFLKENKNYIEIVVKAKDEFRALSKGRYQLIGISSHISFLKHAEELSISETALIEIISKSKIIKSSEISSPIYRRPDTIKTNDFNDKFEKIVDIETTNEIEFNTLQRLNLAFQRHSVSLKSSSFENQLVDLWSGIECLLPVYNKDSDDKIVQIINYISPILVHNYISKLLIDLRESLNFSINKVKIKKFLKNKGINTLKDLAELILIRESSDIEELYSLLDSNILLIDRIKYFQGIFKKPTRVKSRLVSHERRLKWQIQRIYRARNLIIHSGKTPYQLETLIENLHYYFDTLMNVCISNLAENDEYKTITDIVNHYSIKKCAYYNFLDSIKKEEINSENISSILSISQI